MSVTAPGSGSSPPGGPQQLTALEIELSAATTNLRTQLGVLRDSMEVPFSQLDAAATWKYQSTSSNPTLSPMVRVRTSGTSPRESDKTWTEEFSHLLDLLPEEIKRQLIIESKLPPEERNPAFGALDSTLGAMAKAIVWLKAASKPVDTSLGQEPFYAHVVQQGALANGNAVLTGAHTFMEEQGHNMVHFDGLTKFVTQIDDGLDLLNRLSNPSDLQIVAKRLESLNTQLNRTYLGDELQILKPMLAALTLVAAAATLNPGTSPLLIGLSAANIGIEKGVEAGGALPPLLTQLRDKLSNGLSPLLPNASVGSQQLLPLLLTTGLLSTVAFTQLFHPKDTKSALPLTLALHMAISSGIVSGVSSGIVQACGADTKTKTDASNMVACSAVLLMILAAAPDNRSTAVSLTASFHPYLSKLLDNFGSLTEPNALAVSVQQARIALQQHDYEGFVQTILDASNLLQASDDPETVVRKQMNTFKDFISTVQNALMVKQEQLDNPTGIIQG